MSGAKKRVPKRRFKEFLNAGEWEQRKLGEIADITKLAGFEFTKYIVYSDKGNIIALRGLNIKDGDLNLEDVKYIDSSDFTKLKRSKLFRNDILFTYVGTIGEVARIQEDDKYYLAPNVSRIRIKNRLLSEFLMYYMDRDLFYQKIIFPLIATSSQPALSMANIREFNITYPCDINEQQKIALVFSLISHLITLHQRKLDKLQATKKALLQEMFPEEGQDKPKRRFKGFTDAWEQRKLLTVLNKIVDYRGRTPKKLGLDWSLNGHLALSALNVKMGYVDKTVDAHYGDDHLYSVWMKDNDLYEGQVLFTTEAPMGNVAQVPDNNKYILSQRTIAFVPDRSVISDNFLAVVLSASKCQKSLINRASGGTAKGVSQKTLSEIFLDIPQSLSEQDKVSELIKKLSKIITLHQRKLDKLKNLKQAYLNEIFV